MLACQNCGFLPQVAQQATQIQTVLAMVKSGLGVGLVPSVMQRFTGHKIVFRELTDLPEGSGVGLALAHKPEREGAAAQRFRATALREYAGRPAAQRPRHAGLGGAIDLLAALPSPN